MIMAPKVIKTDPMIIGNIPKLAGLFDGDQSCPKRKLLTPYLPMNGRPFIKIKTQINRMAIIAVAALRKNIILKISSFKACFFTRFPF